MKKFSAENSMFFFKILTCFFTLASILSSWTGMTSCEKIPDDHQNGITKEWLEKILSRKIDKLQVEPGSNPGDGWVGVTSSIQVNFDENGGNNQSYSQTQPLNSDVDPLTLTSTLTGANTNDNGTHFLFLKSFPTNIQGTNSTDESILLKNSLFLREFKTYQIILPELVRFLKEEIFSNNNTQEIVQVPFPPLIFGHVDDLSKLPKENPIIPSINSLENCLLFPDLKNGAGFKMLDRFKPVDFDHYNLVFESLARFHALGWAYKKKALGTEENLLQKFPFLKLKNGGKSADFNEQITQDFKIFENAVFANTTFGDTEEEGLKYRAKFLNCLNHTHELVPTILSLYYDYDSDADSGKSGQKLAGNEKHWNKDNILRIPTQTIENEVSWNVLTHGDCQRNNWLFHYREEEDGTKLVPDKVMFVDLQVATEGDPMTDLVFAWYLATTSDFREKYEDDLLQTYFKTYRSVCDKLGVAPPPDFQISELARRFHRAKIVGVIQAIYQLPILVLEEVFLAQHQSAGDNNKEDEKDFTQHLDLLTPEFGQTEQFKIRAFDLLIGALDDGVI